MNLIVDIHNKIVKIILLEGKNEKDEIEIEEFNNLSEKLLPTIAEILEKNDLKPKNIGKMELKTDLNDGFTTFRIAKTVVDTFNFGK